MKIFSPNHRHMFSNLFLYNMICRKWSRALIYEYVDIYSQNHRNMFSYLIPYNTICRKWSRALKTLKEKVFKTIVEKEENPAFPPPPPFFFPIIFATQRETGIIIWALFYLSAAFFFFFQFGQVPNFVDSRIIIAIYNLIINRSSQLGRLRIGIVQTRSNSFTSQNSADSVPTSTRSTEVWKMIFFLSRDL